MCEPARPSGDYTGIVYLRPGHISPVFVLSLLDAVAALDIDCDPPFIVVATRKDRHVKVRLRAETRESGRNSGHDLDS